MFDFITMFDWTLVDCVLLESPFLSWSHQGCSTAELAVPCSHVGQERHRLPFQVTNPAPVGQERHRVPFQATNPAPAQKRAFSYSAVSVTPYDRNSVVSVSPSTARCLVDCVNACLVVRFNALFESLSGCSYRCMVGRAACAHHRLSPASTPPEFHQLQRQQSRTSFSADRVLPASSPPESHQPQRRQSLSSSSADEVLPAPAPTESQCFQLLSSFCQIQRQKFSSLG